MDPDAPPAWINKQWPRAIAILAWYFHFLKSYCSVFQLSALITVWGAIASLLHWIAAVSWIQSAAVLILPLLLSSWQLFFFGSYRPHRDLLGLSIKPTGIDAQMMRLLPRSTSLPSGLAFLTCYYFGYHCEHHCNPQLPWYDLPKARAQTLASVAQAQS